MLPVLVNRASKGRACPHLSRTLPHEVNWKIYSTSTWAIITWPMITLFHTGITVILSPTMLELLWMSLPKPKSLHFTALIYLITGKGDRCI